MLSQKKERTAESSNEHRKLDNNIYIVLQPSEIQTRIFMETSANMTTERFLHIKNKNEHVLNVNIIRRPPLERFVELSFTSVLIQAKSTVTLKITWSPKKSGFKREILQLTYGSHQKYDIILLMNAQDPPTDTRNQVISASKKSSNSSRNFHVSQNLSSLDNNPVQSSIKRTRSLKKNFEREFSTERVVKKPRTERNKKLLSREEDSVKKTPGKTLRKKSSPTPLPNFSLAIDKINFTPKISASPEGVFEFSRGSSTSIDPQKPILIDEDHVDFLQSAYLLDDFYASTPLKPPSKSKIASYYCLSPACSDLDAEIDEDKENSKPFVLHDAESLLEIPKPCSLQQSVSNKKIAALPDTLNKASKKKTSPAPGGKMANRSLGAKRKINLSLKTEKKASLTFQEPIDFMINFISQDQNGENWTFLQEMEFKKWLNALMTASEHLNTDVDTASVDVGKVWQSCRMREEVILAESKESISARYHTNTRLNTLRKAANVMFRKEEVKEAYSGAKRCIENGSLVCKKDKDPHLDIGLQKEILELFLSYNPLWLRIGLETVYGETIPLQSNNDLIGLTRFLLARFFSDPGILKKHSHPTIVGMKLPNFTTHMKNFMLKKFLQVVYFLDYAKIHKLIGHDPCLFRRNAKHKESRSILLAFSREVLSGIGDITKVLRLAGYVVNYKQAYLDEFDYAVNDVSSDLRDGVRLCRTMELVTGKKNLIGFCRVPAISKLHMVHNVNVALTALLDSGYFLTGEIDAKCIANGDRKKTLSLLWQIIYKFQAPRFEKAATCLQTWWRSKVWYVRIQHFLKKRRNNAASVIQKAWRRHLARKELNQLRVENEKNLEIRKRAVRIIQEWWISQKGEARKQRKDLETLTAVLRIERWWKRIRETKPFVENLRRKLDATKKIQRWWRRVEIFVNDRREFLLMKCAVLILERNWIEKMIREEKKKIIKKIRSAIVIQEFCRRYNATKKEVSQFRLCKQSSLKIQSWWRSVVVSREYKMKRKSALKIQNWWRSLNKLEASPVVYLGMENAALIIQKEWRLIRTMRKYRELKSSVVALQRRWRAKKLAEEVQKNYLQMKLAAVKIQSWFRMVKEKRRFERSLQRKLNAIQIARLHRDEILEGQNTVKLPRSQREAAICIKNWWREVLTKKELEVAKANKMRLENGANIKANWKRETLSKRLQNSINIFLFTNDLGLLRTSLASLDLITRLSANSCITVCKIGMVDKIFQTLVQSNRSLPWVAVCIRSTNILLTLVKYHPTKPFVLKEEYIETLARLLTVTVEKEVELFLHLATLMWFLVEDSKCAQAVLDNARSTWLLKNLCNTVSRKKSKFELANPEEKEELLPNLKPDWGLKQQQPRLFDNVVYATTSIFKRLIEYQQSKKSTK